MAVDPRLFESIQGLLFELEPNILLLKTLGEPGDSAESSDQILSRNIVTCDIALFRTIQGDEKHIFATHSNLVDQRRADLTGSTRRALLRRLGDRRR
jgi:hypothetical protein